MKRRISLSLSLFLEKKRKKKNVLISKQRDRVTRGQNRYPFILSRSPTPRSPTAFPQKRSGRIHLKRGEVESRSEPFHRGTHPGKEDGKIRDARSPREECLTRGGGSKSVEIVRITRVAVW